MDSTPTPKATEPDDALTARPDERLAHAYEQITRADEKLAQLSEQVEKMERDAAPRPPSSAEPPPSAERPPSAEFGLPSPPRRPALRALVGLALAACIIVALLVVQSSYGGKAKVVVARWAPQLVSTPLPPEKTPAPAQPAASSVQLAAADAAAPQAAPVAQAAPHNAPPAAAAPASDQAQVLQTMARDLAELARTVEQLKASQQQMAGDNAKAIEQLKASQEELKRALAKVSEQNVPKDVPRASPPPTQPSATLRRLGRTVQAPRPRPRPPRTYSREWIYDDYDW